jgi:phosphoglycolate phosphatase-like HAD superfamily hydrolase
MFEKYETIIWDFDGVIMDSMPIRSKGFELVLSDYPLNQVSELINFHNANGGLSRYVKFRYFFEKIRNEEVSDLKLKSLTSKFSEIMLSNLVNKDLLINDSLNFIKENFNHFNMHIASGSDGNELNIICRELELSKYFISINGSPTPKNTIVKTILEDNKLNRHKVVLIGDSMNDYDAAKINEIDF